MIILLFIRDLSFAIGIVVFIYLVAWIISKPKKKKRTGPKVIKYDITENIYNDKY